MQCGEKDHWHEPLKNVINLVGQTTTRELIRLMHYAGGVVCPVTFAMHLAAAVETRPGRPPLRPCVVIAGGRDAAHWEAYPGHQFLQVIGMLACCQSGGCWKSRCQPVGDGDEKDRDLCEQPVQIRSDLRIARCMAMITPGEVDQAIERYLPLHMPAGHDAVFSEAGTPRLFGNANSVAVAAAAARSNGDDRRLVPLPDRTRPRNRSQGPRIPGGNLSRRRTA